MDRWPWHPVLFAAVIVLTAWLDAAVSPFAAFRSMAVAVALAAALTCVLGLLLRSATLGGVAASILIGLLWSRQLIDAAVDLGSRMGALALVWAALIGLALLVAVRLVGRTAWRPNREDVTLLLNRAGLLLLVATLALGLVRGRMAAVADDLSQGVPLGSLPPALEPAPGMPDPGPGPSIYLVLLDGYPRADVLEYAFGFDNGPFLAALAERGFVVARRSHSDYLWTHVSVPSALNLAYVEQIPAMREVMEGRAPRQPTLRTTLADNAAFGVAREHGYVTVAVGSGFEEVAARRAAVYVDGGQLNEFEISLLTSTFAADVLNVVAPGFAAGQQRDRIGFNLDVLGDIAAANLGRAFVFAHVPAPHQPTVFGTDGAPLAVKLSPAWFADSPPERGEDPAEFADRYRAGLPYLNQRILAAVDGILAASDAPPVIILWADHGSASVVDWNATQPDEADPARLLERTGTLFAALTPGRTGVFPEDISPVDILRLLFDAYLGTDYGRAVPPEGGGQVPPVDASVLEAP